jgi:hypothetical protein
MLRDIEVDDAATIVRQDDEDIQDSQTNRRDCEEINGYQLSNMIAKKRQPSLSGFLSFGINRETVRSEISKPSFNNSPWMRGAPQMGLAPAMVRTNLRISRYTRGRPDPLDWDNLHQYRLNLFRCHPVTVSG